MTPSEAIRHHQEQLSARHFEMPLFLISKAGDFAFVAPHVFMTDNSRPEKDALRSVWPSAQQLLCHFHVLQAEWRWLTSSKSNVLKDDRRRFMAAFQKILYAQDDQELQAAKEALHALGHVPYSQRVQAFLQCEQQWVLLYRAGLMTRGHNTNNYSEASIRILKDIVLCRTKAYNAVALVEYIMTKWEEYFKLRLLHHAQHREPSHQIRFQNLLEKMPDVPSESIVCLGNAMYSVPSSSGTAAYEVDAESLWGSLSK
ncbi:uncharacterized protein LOC119381717 [Rhipicephalus sanguineus]|uniref:uncharacterized protein LOC119381717 n=1 Tax=Rhipicephalus sanguineus TaxID=34632 RepID=UPI0020C35D1F|nr:uncharacterized protein LOC119381717 [Rhipicephalus sanguineus]